MCFPSFWLKRIKFCEDFKAFKGPTDFPSHSKQGGLWTPGSGPEPNIHSGSAAFFWPKAHPKGPYVPK